MKFIENGKKNTLMFVNSGISLSDVSKISLRQIGSETEKLLIPTFDYEDCFVSMFSVTLTPTFTPNGMYEVNLTNISGDVLLSDAAIVSNMDINNKRQWIIEETINEVLDTLSLPLNLNSNL